MKGIVQRVVRDHFGEYRKKHRLSVRELRATEQIATCRTAAQGYHIWDCPSGDYRSVQANSCKHRSCPLCGAVETERWVQQQQARALPCRYHHIVFTIPHSLHPLWFYNRQGFTNLLFRAAWTSLRGFCLNPKWLGAEPGALAVFQSWGETLNTHVHLHVLITAGGLSPAGQWVAPATDFLFPCRALSKVFAGTLRAALLEALAAPNWSLPPDTTPARCRTLLNRLGRQLWHVQIQPAYDQPHRLIIYLARYLRRGPIAESRIIRYDGHRLLLTYKRPGEHQHATFQLTTTEFMRRLLVHVPTKGIRLVRAYGLFHHRRRTQLEQARATLPPHVPTPGLNTVKGSRADATPFHRDGPHCPHCGMLLRVTFAFHPPRSPPERFAA